MMELTWVGEALRWAGWLYWLIALGALVFMLTMIETVRGKVIGAGIVVALFGYIAGGEGPKVIVGHGGTKCIFAYREVDRNEFINFECYGGNVPSGCLLATIRVDHDACGVIHVA